jgi:hypothetical protein
MSEWLPDWVSIFGIAAFIVASIAVRGWRDLGVLVLLIALMVFPLKWLGAVIGLPALAQDAMTWQVTESGSWKLSIKPSAAFIASAFLGALVMLAWKRAGRTQRARVEQVPAVTHVSQTAAAGGSTSPPLPKVARQHALSSIVLTKRQSF